MFKKKQQKEPKQAVLWCSKTLLSAPYYYGLCTSAKKFARWQAKLGIPKEDHMVFLDQVSFAETFLFRGKDKHVVIVNLRDTKNLSDLEVYSILTHEGVHVWQIMLEAISETKPSEEFEAYSIQEIVQNLVLAWNKSKGRKVEELFS